jgi:hypothetical protein
MNRLPYFVQPATPSINSAILIAIVASAVSPPCAATSKSRATASQWGRSR